MEQLAGRQTLQILAVIFGFLFQPENAQATVPTVVSSLDAFSHGQLVQVTAACAPDQILDTSPAT